jgi:hypothetical protein
MDVHFDVHGQKSNPLYQGPLLRGRTKIKTFKIGTPFALFGFVDVD